MTYRVDGKDPLRLVPRLPVVKMSKKIDNFLDVDDNDEKNSKCG